MRKLLLPVMVGLLALGSCDKNKVFEDTTDLPNAYWMADSIKTFAFTITNPDKAYNLYFNLRNGLEYPHRNIYVQYTIRDSANTIREEELRNFQLFHPKSGYPFGSGSGNVYQHQFDLLVGYTFPFAGTYRISLQQYMRYDSLPQVYSVGVRVEAPEE